MSKKKFLSIQKKQRKFMLSILCLSYFLLGIGYAVLNTNLEIIGRITIKGKIEVTFDANEGSVDVQSKEIMYGKNYGTLPTPTRYAYDFLGWNGKNMFNYDDILFKSPLYVSRTTLNDMDVITWDNNNSTDNFKMLEGYFKDNKQYMFSGNMATSKNNKIAIKIVYSDGTSSVYDYDILKQNSSNPQLIQENTFYKFYFSSQPNKTISYIRGIMNDNEKIYIDINSFQIEEGNDYTKYEPFYINESTKVVQKENHILKAIWKIKNKYTEELLNGADPIYSDNLIPVTISDNGIVRKADLYSKWYSYNEKQWANAVVLVNSQDYAVGEEIPLSNIESFFVWVPKFSYKIWDLGNYSDRQTDESLYVEKNHPIDIRFGLENTSNSAVECTPPMTSGTTGQCDIGKYMTHPAFVSMNTNGIWVGKFETGYVGASTTTESEIDEINIAKIIIKPDTYSWRNITLANAYNNSYNYMRNEDSHLIKNTEWGAVAYLSNSIYGSCSGNSCQKVRINNNSAYVTGYGAKTEPTCGYTGEQFMNCRTFGSDNQYGERWVGNNGKLASTTLNTSGIYDMSGGAWEFVSAFRLDSTNTYLEDQSVPLSSAKYYDTYNYADIIDKYQNRILGDASGELGPFFYKKYKTITDEDYVRRISSWNYSFSEIISKKWISILRGGDYVSGSDSGTLALYVSTNSIHKVIGYRIVLTY